ncbi:MAG: peptidylprolyl isomerase [Myxococcota bacterium]
MERETARGRLAMARALAAALAFCLGGVSVPVPGQADEPAGEPAGEETVAAVDELLQLVDSFIASKSIDRSQRRWKERVPPPPMLRFDPERRYLWELETNRGRLVIRLLPDVAPVHVSSTIYLTRLGFYDSLGFHRVIPGFMAQGGDPKGNGTGDPGYRYAGEFRDSVRHTKRGLISMANGGPGTDGSQFFILFDRAPHLDGKHTIFGEVIAGRRTLERIEELGTRSGSPKREIRIEKASIRVE